MFTLALAEQGGGARRLLPLRQHHRALRHRTATASPASRPSTGRETADAYVCALGPYAPILLRTVGIRLPIYPIKGYSITLPVTDDAAAPQSTLMDETHKVAITRLGDRIRVAGQAEIIGYNRKLGRTRHRHRPPRRHRPLPQGRRRLAAPRAGPACGR